MTDAQKYTAELLGTLVVVFVGTAALITTGGNLLVTALAFGLAWAGMWWVFGNVSGGHFNPAITIATAIARRMNNKDVVPYIVVQVLGGILASVLLMVALRGAPEAFTAAPLAANLGAVDTTTWNMTSIIVVELLFTAFLSLIWLAATEKTNASGITGLGVGLGYTGILLGGMAVTWSAFNPARTLGAIVLGEAGFAGVWTVWVGCIVGAIVGAGIWLSVVHPARTTAPTPTSTEA